MRKKGVGHGDFKKLFIVYARLGQRVLFNGLCFHD